MPISNLNTTLSTGTAVLATLLAFPSVVACQSTDPRIDALTNRIEQLETQVRYLESLLAHVNLELHTKNLAVPQKQMRARFAEDRLIYPGKEQEIETLFQITHSNPSNPKGLEALNKLITQYPKANRTGCAIMEAGAVAQGEQKEAHLKTAIADYSGSFFGNSLQVGAYARFLLAMYYRQSGRDAASEALFDEIRKDYPGAVNPNGDLLIESVPVQTGLRGATLRTQFDARMQLDRKTYSPEELNEIDALYANASANWMTPSAVESLRKLTSKYTKANRAGCALLYLGQMSTGEEREKYFKAAIAGYSDSLYGDSVQVGAYARYLLAFDYRQNGRLAEATALFDVIRRDYPEAVDHDGNLLTDSIPK